MSLDRRRFLQLAGLGAAGTMLSGCAPLYQQLAGGPETLSAWLPAVDEHFPVLRRLTYGPTAAERLHAAEIGIAAWIEEQLAYEQIDDRPAALRVRRYDLIERGASELITWDMRDVIVPFKQATMIRRLYSPRQLYEMMVEFWTDHFNIAATKEDCWALKVVDDRAVIRPHALGNFRELLQASAHSPAMLIYLDNQANVKEHPNENYAREVMELHTLGVDGGYTQEDVMELARLLTGWTVKEHFWWGDFTFDQARHDTGPKRLLGHAFPAGGGLAEGERALDILADHPSTARYIATKLVRRFVCDRPLEDEPALVEKGAATFTRTGGDIRAVLRVILLDGLAGRVGPLPPKLKRPVQFVASALRQIQAESDGGTSIQDELRLMGQADYEWPTPDGPPDTAAAWQRDLLPRWRFAVALARDQLGKTSWQIPSPLLKESGDPAVLLDRLSDLLLGGRLAPPIRQSLLENLPSASRQDPAAALPLLAAALVASPAFQWR